MKCLFKGRAAATQVAMESAPPNAIRVLCGTGVHARAKELMAGGRV